MCMLRPARLAGAALTAALLPAAPALAEVHTVAPGETLSGIAAANRLSTASLASANGLSPEARVIAGATLRLPGLGAAPSSSGMASSGSSGSNAGGGHRVALGDTLSGI